jgi:nucleoside-diphosphate-sugar epimerase
VRVVVVGASGNVGTSVLRSLADEPAVQSVVGVSRRAPGQRFATTEWRTADVSRDDLVPIFRGADVVVHLAWLIQPSHDERHLFATNVEGSRRVFRAVADAGVRGLVYASSVGAYSAGPKDRAVDESWPTGGLARSSYSRHKVAVERELDAFERAQPGIRVVRMRPAFIMKREAGAGVRRLFLGPFVPSPLLRPGLIPFVPEHPRFRFQCVHSHDAGDAYRLAIVGDARGAFNLAAEPVLDGPVIARALRSRTVRVPHRLARALLQATWRLRLQPADGGWMDLAYGVPLLDASRARAELGWAPRRDAVAALLELTSGIADAAGIDTPPLTPETSRLEELQTGVGGTERL